MPALNFDHLRVVNGNGCVPLPAWARSAIEIGAWARSVADSSATRLLLCCVVPSRAPFTALVGFGAVAQGGTFFRSGFSWHDLQSLEAGTPIFWKAPEVPRQRLGGILEPIEEVSGQVMVPVKITKGPRKMKGSRWFFTESKFRDCAFSEEMLPTAKSSEQFAKAREFYRMLGVSASSSWLVTAGPEVRFIGNYSAFCRSLMGWQLTSTSEHDAASVDQLLILKKDGDKSLAKSRISHNTGAISGDAPVSIIDGPLAVRRVQDTGTGSVIIVLARDEVAEEHIHLLIEARNDHSENAETSAKEMAPQDIPAEIELAAYCI